MFEAEETASASGGKAPGIFKEQSGNQWAWSKVNWRWSIRIKSSARVRSWRDFAASCGKEFAFYSNCKEEPLNVLNRRMMQYNYKAYSYC